LGLLDGKFYPTVHELTEGLVSCQSPFDRIGTVSPNETADGFASMDIGKLVVRAVPAGMVRIHAATASASTDLILH
jgi:hypothetical protein